MLQTRRTVLVGGASTVCLAACSGIIGPTNAPAQIYVLAPDLQAMPQLGKVSWQLSVGRPEASESLSVERIALRRGATMDYFADGQWTDNVPLLIQTLLVEAFEKSGRIGAVAKDLAAIRADYILESELHGFEARYDGGDAAPTVVVDITAKLLAAKSRDIASVHDARHESRASVNSVPAVVSAFDEATSAVLEDIVAWALGAAPPTTDAVVVRPRSRR
jgi:cholesterol transport system auxiliary component